MLIDLTHPQLFDVEPISPLAARERRRPRRYQTVVDDTHKVCLDCREARHISGFGPQPIGVLGCSAICRVCAAAVARRTRQAMTPEQLKDRQLRQVHGITLEEYLEMLATQDGRCAICRLEEVEIDERSGKRKDLVVDHNHATGEVRGLLCGRCNRGSGYFGDDPEKILEAAVYLEDRGHYAPHARRLRKPTGSRKPRRRRR